MSRQSIGNWPDPVRHGGFRDAVARTGTSGGQIANCNWHLRTVLKVTDGSRQGRRLLGGEIE
jgi:hypothetical protein